jgi:hypothetical protein
MLRILLLAIAFYLLFRLIQGVVRYFLGLQDRWREESRRTVDAEGESRKNEVEEYRDVKDASFKDLPDDKNKPS